MNEVCDVISFVLKCMFFEEFIFVRVYTYTVRIFRGRFRGCIKFEVVLWASNFVYLGCKKLVL